MSSREAEPASGSRTVLVENTPSPQNSDAEHGTLRLRGARTRRGPRVQWQDDVVDNEGLGRKSSKVCCIYRKPRNWDDPSSSEESSSDSSDSSDDEHGHNHGRKGKRPCKHNHEWDGTGIPPANAYEK